MLETLHRLWEIFLSSFQWGLGVLFSNIFTVVGFVLAIAIIIRVFREQRQPSSLLAWSYFVLLIPYVGVPLYLLFGGRKLKKRIRAKGLLKRAAEGDTDLSYAEDTFSARGNRVEFITDGVQAYRLFRDAITAARKEIHILTYILSDDAVGNHILRLLTDKANSGVRVRLLLDALGSFRRPRKSIRSLQEAGGEVHLFMPAFPFQTHGWANLRNHRKIAVFDCEHAILGGRNLDSRFLGSVDDPDRFHDFGADYRGPIVNHFNGIFLLDWAFASKQAIPDMDCLQPRKPVAIGPSEVAGIASGPDVEGDPLYERMVNLMQEFERDLIIVTPYFIPDEILTRTLVVKARSGKKITLVLPEHSNWKLVDLARSYHLRILRSAGIEVLLFQPGMLHAKIMVADGSIAIHGSANLDIRSLFVNFEIGVVHTSEVDIRAIMEWLEQIMGNCRLYGLERELNPPRLRRTLEEATRLISPLL